MVTRLAARMPCASCCSRVLTWAMASFTRTVEMLGNCSVTAMYMAFSSAGATRTVARKECGALSIRPGDSTSMKFWPPVREIHFAQIGDAAVDLAPQHIQGHACRRS